MVATFFLPRDAECKHIHFASLSGIGPVAPCVRFANSLRALQVEVEHVNGRDKLNVEPA